jgi:hypothetical protein
MGKPLAGKTIRKEDLNDVLGKYIDNGDIVQFDGYYSDEGYITLWLIVPNNYHAKTVYAMRDELVVFFRDRQEDLAKEYGQFDTIFLDFGIKESGDFRWVYYMTYRNNEWLFRQSNDFRAE